MTADGFKDQFPLIKKAIYAKLPNYSPDDIKIGETLYRIDTIDHKQYVGCILACTDNGHLWIWHADYLMDWYRSLL